MGPQDRGRIAPRDYDGAMSVTFFVDALIVWRT
jgi:hypothetical protein